MPAYDATARPLRLGEVSLPEGREIAKKALAKSGEDRLGLAAAGVAFYAFLALVPLLLATVLIYGLVADMATVARHVRAVAGFLPSGATDLVQEQLESIVAGSSGTKGFGLVAALGVALFSARNGAAAMLDALAIVYERRDRRSFLRRALLALALTLAAILGGAAMVGAVVVLAALGSLIPGLGAAAPLYKAATYLLLLAGGMAGAALLYRFGPPEGESVWQWATPGSAFAGAGLVVLTLGFGFYVDNFGNYQATYGSLSAVIVLLSWLYLSAYVVLFGAELNAASRQLRRAGSAS